MDTDVHDLAEDILTSLPVHELAAQEHPPLVQFLVRVRRLVQQLVRDDPTRPRISVRELRARRISQQAQVNTLELLLLRLANAQTYDEQHQAVKEALQSSYQRGVIAGQTEIERVRALVRESQQRTEQAEEEALAAARLLNRAHYFFLKLRRGDLNAADLPAEFLSALTNHGHAEGTRGDE